MLSSLLHLAITFKLYFHQLPFMPWKWSELPLENYFSSVRFLNGNDDEFSTMEYLSRSKKLAEQRCAPSGNILDTRIGKRESSWKHPKDADKDKHPQLFDHSWELSDLLVGFEQCDHRLVEEFMDLGMADLLQDEPLFKVMAPAERLSKLRSQVDKEEPLAKILIDDQIATSNYKVPFPDVSCAEPVSLDKRIINISADKYVCFKGKLMTASKYVTKYHQRDNRKLAGSRNKFRFMMQDDVEEETHFETIQAGDFILTVSYGIIEILQLSSNGFLHSNEGAANVKFLGVAYKKYEDKMYFTEAKYTKKYYHSLKDFFLEKVECINKWYEGSKKFVKLEVLIPDGSVEMDHTTDEEESATCYCFCRVTDVDGGYYIECSSQECRIKWYHIKCLHLNKVPSGKWVCPRCKGEDHWCTCGEKENYGEMVGCSAGEHCKVEWFHIKCVGLQRIPVGDWYCEECLAEQEFESAICHCGHPINMDQTIKCRSRRCRISIFHECCVDADDTSDEWYCKDCQ